MNALNTSKKSSGERNVALFILALIIVPITIWDGFVLKTLWNWFIPAIFHGSPRLGIAQGIGISLVVTFFIHKREKSDEQESPLKRTISVIFDDLMYGAVSLLAGVIVYYGFIH